jgi:hypothetical protein
METMQQIRATIIWPGAVDIIREPPPPEFRGLGISVLGGKLHRLYLNDVHIGAAAGFPREIGSKRFFTEHVIEEVAITETEIDCVLNLPTLVAMEEPALDGALVSVGASLIYGERQRQVEKGYGAEHDDVYNDDEALVRAALSYLRSRGNGSEDAAPADWPWDAHKWKPGAAIDDLVKAGALIAAEIDRLSRAGAVSKYSDPIEL